MPVLLVLCTDVDIVETVAGFDVNDNKTNIKFVHHDLPPTYALGACPPSCEKDPEAASPHPLKLGTAWLNSFPPATRPPLAISYRPVVEQPTRVPRDRHTHGSACRCGVRYVLRDGGRGDHLTPLLRKKNVSCAPPIFW